jgi:hypothetical protein
MQQEKPTPSPGPSALTSNFEDDSNRDSSSILQGFLSMSVINRRIDGDAHKGLFLIKLPS